MDELAEIERAMITIRRSQSRRALSRVGTAGDSAVFGVLDAIEEAGGPCSVGEVAAALGVDQPRASRLVARAVADGLIVRQADQQDGRRTLLALTARAHAHLAGAHASRQAVFARAMADWPDQDRAAFARLLGSFTASLGALTSPSPGR
ncbi:MarR family winged helix-turn-helix transcriptional regulator [Actinoplanes sp. NPDC049668]|uniref:MarR family winged helix-turn-helix transcriptional regulator n=1 Tax=unclassified Actinoplanes TaxID=2626549 RepID=UPI00339F501C